MIDRTPPPLEADDRRRAGRAAGTARRGPAAPRQKTTARRSRIAAVGIGVAAMAGLVSTMEVAAKEASPATPAAPFAVDTAAQRAYDSWQRRVAKHEKYVALEQRRPIVLTPHTVVNTVSAPSSGGSSYVAGPSYSAPSYSAPAAAPAASSGGSHP